MRKSSACCWAMGLGSGIETTDGGRFCTGLCLHTERLYFDCYSSMPPPTILFWLTPTMNRAAVPCMRQLTQDSRLASAYWWSSASTYTPGQGSPEAYGIRHSQPEAQSANHTKLGCCKWIHHRGIFYLNPCYRHHDPSLFHSLTPFRLSPHREDGKFSQIFWESNYWMKQLRISLFGKRLEAQIEMDLRLVQDKSYHRCLGGSGAGSADLRIVGPPVPGRTLFTGTAEPWGQARIYA